MKPQKTISYRLLEILPGVAIWTTFLGAVVFSRFFPFWVAAFIILFDLYWVLKAVNTALHLLSSFFKMKLYSTYDWSSRLLALQNPASYIRTLRAKARSALPRGHREDLRQELIRLDRISWSGRILDYKQVCHVVLLPTYDESLEVIDHSVRAVAEAEWPGRIFFVLATEEREGGAASEKARVMTARYADRFWKFAAIQHPDGTPGEIKAKGANLTFAAKRATAILQEEGVPTDHVLVSAFDSDTVVSKNYFLCLSYAFLTSIDPYRTSYQPMPVYNNNIWDAPAITRVVAVANSFWQLVEASRPDRLVTFSSHAMTLRALLDVDYWPVDVVSDDSQIFWRCWLHYHGDYRTMPLFTTVSLDAMLDKTYIRTLWGQYKQKRRWAYGIENFPYLTTNAFRDPQIPLWKKILFTERMFESFYFWATASIIITALGWLPLLVGVGSFGDGVLAVNLPILTRNIMMIATCFLIFSVYINLVLIPKRPPQYSRWRSVSMILQWVFVPIVSTVFGSLPAVDALTRLMLGRYMEFWVTPKARRGQGRESALALTESGNKII